MINLFLLSNITNVIDFHTPRMIHEAKQCDEPVSLSLKVNPGKIETGSAAVILTPPQSPFSLKSIEKTLQIATFQIKNRTPIPIHIKSKGTVVDTRNDFRLFGCRWVQKAIWVHYRYKK